MDWGGRSDWDAFRQDDPLGGGSFGGVSIPDMYSYGSRQSSGWGMDYDPTYGRSSMGYDPTSNFSWSLISSNIDSYLEREYPELYRFDSGSVNFGHGAAGDVSQNPGFAGGNFNKDPRVFDEIASAAAQFGVPANLLKSMIARESTGDWERDGFRTPMVRPNDRILPYVGIFESTAAAWGYDFNQMVGNRALQIEAMASGLRRLYDSVGEQYGWEGVISTYYSGDPTGAYTPGDSYQHGTTKVYTSQVMNWWRAEDAWTQANGGVLYDPNHAGMFGGEGGDRGPVTAVEATWGGRDFGLTQHHGNTGAWVQQNPGMYDYSYSLLGYLGHPGIDVGMPIGTDLFSPVSGTVIVAGGSGSFRHDPSGNAPQTGELRIRLDNGHEVILGHMAGVQVVVGDRVQPGQRVGVSGYAGSGPHLHLEYRVPRADGSWAAIDPYEALGGSFTGSFSGQSQGAGYSRPQTFQELLRAGASGGVIYGGSEFSGGTPNTWGGFLRDQMMRSSSQSSTTARSGASRGTRFS